MVLRSMSRDVAGFANDFDISGRDLRGPYFYRWTEGMRDAVFGNTRSGSSMLRILRRSMYERSKHLESEVGDVPLRSGNAIIDRVPDNFVPLSQSSLKREAVSAERLAEAERWMASSSSSDNSESLDERAARNVHERAIDLLSECIRRVSLQARLYLKRGKIYLELGKLLEARLDVEQGLKVYFKLATDCGLEDDDHDIIINVHMSENYHGLQGELRRLDAAVATKRLEKITAPQKVVELCESQLKKLESLSFAFKRGVILDFSFLRTGVRGSVLSAMQSSTIARSRLYTNFFENTHGEAVRKLGAPKTRSSAQPSSYSVPEGSGHSYEPKSANLPPAAAASPSFPSTTHDTLSNQRNQKPEAEEFMLDKVCCFELCDQKTREIRRKEQWAETVCETGCEAVCHKKCYRTFKGVHGNMCASCGKHAIQGKALFMTVETASDLRSKRPPIPRSSHNRRTSKVEIAETVDHSPSSCIEKRLKAVPPSQPLPKSASAISAASVSGQVGAPSSKSEARHPSSVNSVLDQENCSICSKTFNSNAQYLVHVNSKKHLVEVEKASRGETRLEVQRLSSLESSRNEGDLHGFYAKNAENLRPPRWYEAIASEFAPLSDGLNQVKRELVSDQDLPQIDHFGISEAIAVVSKAIEDTTTESGQDSVRLRDLEPYLDMSAYNVTDVENYFLEHFQSLRLFLQRQQQHFWVSSFSFRQPNPELSIRGRKELNVPHSYESASSSDHISVPAEAPPPSEFPTLAEGNLAELVGGLDVLRRLQPTIASESSSVDPRPRLSGSLAVQRKTLSFAMGEEYFEATECRVKEGKEECGICLCAKGTHETYPCACKSLFCESCLSDWLTRKRKTGDWGTCCITCGLVGQFTGIRKAGN